jgi:hypothetical protein
MEHPAVGAQGEERRLWLHPSHATISATLKALHAEQLAEGQQGRILEGVILLPEWEAAQWKSLAGGMTRVGGWEAGAAILEEWRGRHGWHDVQTLTSTGVYCFPDVAHFRPERADRDALEAGDYVAVPVPPSERPDGGPETRLALYRVEEGGEEYPGFFAGV